ncbi:adenosine deaminase/editase [Collybia nuda]|uniref:Adenosine deaminase/editase n=1 Tax=Collybia nuda TaxID=64659 RepID=A0A9P5YCT7_9AGAR|nr:adenosine deaminase/editase [Collybia nuda]
MVIKNLTSVDTEIAAILDSYSATSFTPPASQYTVAAAFFLTQPFKLISIATGTKCLPTIRLPSTGEALHDSHAEVLARRGAVRWFLDEVTRCSSTDQPYSSPWIYASQNKRYSLHEGVQLHLYISTVPCGDASTRFLASLQDVEMATLKDSTVFVPLSPGAASRGRDNYSRLGVLRTKPGRADSPPTLSMSCSDKIASWNVLGFQGALASHFLGPLYLSRVIIGEVPLSMQSSVREDCERALWRRLEGIHNLPSNYTLHAPAIHFTSLQFFHSRSVLEETGQASGSCNESLCWIANTKPHEILINGLKRGVSPKHRHREKSRPRTSKMALFQLYANMTSNPSPPQERPTTTYYEAKRMILDYQTAKECLMGPGGPFSGWVRGGVQWQNFAIDGNKHHKKVSIMHDCASEVNCP